MPFQDCMKKGRLLSSSSCLAVGIMAPSLFPASRTICHSLLSSVCLTGAAALATQLDEEVASYRGQAFAASTKKTYQSHLKSYLVFCEELNIAPVPVSDFTVARYAAYLARRLKPSSVKQYLNNVRLLHLECNLPNPCEDSWYLKTTMKGIEKSKGTDVCRKTPVTPALLLRMREKLDMCKTVDCVFWAACLVMCFGLLRKSNLFGTDATGFQKKKNLTRDSFIVTDNDAVTIRITWSKTNQSKERVMNIRLPVLPNHFLCPVAAVIKLFSVTSPASPKDPAFPMTGSAFNRKLRALSAAVGMGGLTSHSFRRGGATHALSCGIPGEIVKAMGDWRSTCYLVYLDQIPPAVIDHYRIQFGTCLPQTY